MALSIKDEQTDRMVRRYARLHGTSYTRAIRIAIGDALTREGHGIEDEERSKVARDFLDRVREVQQKVAALPTLDSRTPDEILGYDEYGLPN